MKKPHLPRAVVPQAVPPQAPLTHPALFFNQELSWVDFNWRVLHLAMDERTPLLERVRFIAITASNLDEFVQKRMGGLMRQEAAGVEKLSPDGRSPTEQLVHLQDATRLMHYTLTETWAKLIPLLSDELGINICHYDDLEDYQLSHVLEHFQSKIYPILTPLTIDPGHPFPFISNLSLSLAIILRHPTQGTTHFARLKVPSNHPRFLPLLDEDGDETFDFLPIEQLIAHHIDELFPGLEIVGAHAFRVTRNADLRRNEEEASDLVSMIADELRERRFASVVRLEVDKDMPLDELDLLRRELSLDMDAVYKVEGLLDLTCCMELANLPFPKYQYPAWTPLTPARLRQTHNKTGPSIFSIIRQGDLLVHHPYDSFATSTQRLVEEAAEDNHVLAIKQTLYRTSDESPIVKALIQAAESGKQVAVLVEVTARFDEANNIEWARMLENSGVHVAYGLVGLKTHTKATLIVRREPEGIRTYCHIGTGNYHPKTARLYTDLGLLTCNPALGRDIVNLFHFLTGYALNQHYDKVLIAPQNMRKTFNRLIDEEIEFHQTHGTGRIIVKMNAIDDLPTIQRLYKASQAGVQIDLIIRGHSRLRPGLPGYSDNIRLISILGRFLEHDRIFYFHRNGQPHISIGSADWRGRNLNDRVELITPIEDPALQAQIIHILELALDDNTLAWELDSDGYYYLRRPKKKDSVRNFHQQLMHLALERQ